MFYLSYGQFVFFILVLLARIHSLQSNAPAFLDELWRLSPLPLRSIDLTFDIRLNRLKST